MDNDAKQVCSSKTTKKAEGCPNITLIWSAGWLPSIDRRVRSIRRTRCHSRRRSMRSTSGASSSTRRPARARCRSRGHRAPSPRWAPCGARSSSRGGSRSSTTYSTASSPPSSYTHTGGTTGGCSPRASLSSPRTLRRSWTAASSGSGGRGTRSVLIRSGRCRRRTSPLASYEPRRPSTRTKSTSSDGTRTGYSS